LKRRRNISGVKWIARRVSSGSRRGPSPPRPVPDAEIFTRLVAQPAEAKKRLRADSAYAGARLCFDLAAALSLMGLVAAIVMAIRGDSGAWPVYGSAVAAGFWGIVRVLAHAIFDLADAAIRD